MSACQAFDLTLASERLSAASSSDHDLASKMSLTWCSAGFISFAIEHSTIFPSLLVVFSLQAEKSSVILVGIYSVTIPLHY